MNSSHLKALRDTLSVTERAPIKQRRHFRAYFVSDSRTAGANIVCMKIRLRQCEVRSI